MFLLIAGEGAMGHALDTRCTTEGTPHSFWKSIPNAPIEDAVVVHVGSKQKLLAVIGWCEATKTPLIHAASGLDDCLPYGPSFTIVMAPSLSIRVVKFIEKLKAKRSQIRKRGVTTKITVSHQLSKTTPPGTATAIANLLGVDNTVIEELKSPEEQLAFGVPQEYLGRHSYHRVQMFKGVKCKLTLDVRVNGLDEYAAGALVITRALSKLRSEHRLESGQYSVGYILKQAAKQTVPG